MILYLFKKIVNFFSKRIKFGIQAYFSLEIRLSGSDRLFELWNRNNNVMVRLWWGYGEAIERFGSTVWTLKHNFIDHNNNFKIKIYKIKRVRLWCFAKYTYLVYFDTTIVGFVSRYVLDENQSTSNDCCIKAHKIGVLCKAP